MLTKSWSESLNEGDQVRNLGVEGRMILNSILNRVGGCEDVHCI